MNAIRQFGLLLLFATLVVLGSATPSGAVKVYIVFFDTNSIALTDEAKTVLREVVKLINGVPCRSIELVGHTDGTEGDAKRLALRRARAVRTEMIRLRMSSAVIVRVRGKGADEKMVQAEGPEPQNRRVVVDWCEEDAG
jgi:outer membrane protein OmpA-like peptidoglycan-associated protein